MDLSPARIHQGTPAHLRERLAAERRGEPFLVFRDDEGVQRIVGLAAGATTTLGRSPECDVCLEWDPEVSRWHAEVAQVGEQWVVIDDGLSSNGTFVGGERLAGRRRLADGDVLGLGSAAVVFRQPSRSNSRTTRVSNQPVTAVPITPKLVTLAFAAGTVRDGDL
jgi:pSer/pThr/pTyr-binding forkhead associated (FHA) protein